MEDKKLWTYCYSISPDAKDFVKTVYENTTFECPHYKKSLKNHDEYRKHLNSCKLNIKHLKR